MSNLFEPFHLRDLAFRNRIAMSPMCQYSATEGFANDWHKVHYVSRAVGGAGAIIQESTAVSREGRLTYGDLGLWDDAHIPGLAALVSLIASSGAVPGIQLVHAGRKASHELPWNGGGQLISGPNGWPALAPSAIPARTGDIPPVALSLGAIEKILNDFEDAAQRALEAGYRVIEIHGAHGYLVHQFLSPLSNTRQDIYGGSFENRIRFLQQIVERIVPMTRNDASLWVRISARDWVQGGWDPDQSVRLSRILSEMGVDLIDVSSGGIVADETVPSTPGYQVPFAQRIRSEAGVATGAVGLIREARQADAIIRQGQADLVLIGRELLRNPYFPVQCAWELGEDMPWAKQYERAAQTHKQYVLSDTNEKNNDRVAGDLRDHSGRRHACPASECTAAG